jgi:hypothetical protein
MRSLLILLSVGHAPAAAALFLALGKRVKSRMRMRRTLGRVPGRGVGRDQTARSLSGLGAVRATRRDPSDDEATSLEEKMTKKQKTKKQCSNHHAPLQPHCCC